MTSIPLSAARAKVKRTETQIRELNLAIASAYRGKGYVITSEVNADATQEAWVVRVNPPSEELAVSVGEILHNIRTSLDHLACALAIKHSNSQKGTYFPFGQTAEIFEQEIKRKAKLLSPDAIDIIRALKPYKGGNELLWAIHDLNREDKHINLIPFAIISDIRYFHIEIWNSDFGIVGDRRGACLATEGKGHEMLAKGPDPVIRENDYEFLTLAPGGKFEANIQPTINVSFDKVAATQHQPVSAVLDQMRCLTESILLTFEKRFFT